MCSSLFFNASFVFMQWLQFATNVLLNGLYYWVGYIGIAKAVLEINEFLLSVTPTVSLWRKKVKRKRGRNGNLNYTIGVYTNRKFSISEPKWEIHSANLLTISTWWMYLIRLGFYRQFGLKLGKFTSRIIWPFFQVSQWFLSGIRS